MCRKERVLKDHIKEGFIYGSVLYLEQTITWKEAMQADDSESRTDMGDESWNSK